MKQLSDEQIEGCVRSAKVEGKGCLIPSVLAEHLARELERINGIGEAQPWVWLTDVEIIQSMPDDGRDMTMGQLMTYARSIESKLREKNAGQPAADDKADEAALQRLTQNGAVAWAGVDPQDLREGRVADDKAGAMTPEQIDEVNKNLWDELDEIKEKTGYNAYREANRGKAQWTLMGYLLNLRRMADDKAGGEVVAQIEVKQNPIFGPACIVLECRLPSGVHWLYTRPQPQAEAVRVPDGYALVPVEPTKEMLAAGIDACVLAIHEGPEDVDTLPVCYRAMLAAAPKPQEGGGV